MRIAIMWAVAILWAGSSAACTDLLAQRMVDPPNGNHVQAATAATQPVARGELRIPVGPPTAVLAAWILEPPHEAAPRGTLLVLHGFINDHTEVENAGKALCQAGYRVVLLDLRGHGRSTGDHITYGVLDAHDLSQVVDYLQQHGLCGPTLGVFGTSYGAASAILFAGGDARVTAVVAVAAFASLREEAPYFGRHILPIPGLFYSDADYAAVVNRMGKLAGFDPDQCSPLSAIRNTRAHIRLIHGADDLVVPFQSSQELAAAAPDRTELTVLPGRGHLALCFDLMGELRSPTRAWFDQWMAPAVANEPAAMPRLAQTAAR